MGDILHNLNRTSRGVFQMRGVQHLQVPDKTSFMG